MFKYYSRSLLFYQLCSAGKYNLHLFFFSVFCFLRLKKLSVFKDLVKTWIKLSRTKERPPADRVQVQVPVNKPRLCGPVTLLKAVEAEMPLWFLF